MAAYATRGNAQFSHWTEPAWARQVSMGSSTRFHAPEKLCRSPLSRVIGLDHVFYHCRGRGAAFWRGGDEIASTEDAGEVGSDGKNGKYASNRVMKSIE